MRVRFPSILKRIIWLHLFALIGIAIAVTSAAYFLLNATAADFEERMLSDHATAVAKHLAFNEGVWTVQLPPDLQAIYARGYGGYTLAIVDDHGHTVYSPLPATPLFPPAPTPLPSFFQRNVAGVGYYGISLPVQMNGHSASIQIAQNLESPDVIVDDVVAQFLERIAWIVIPIFGVLLVIDVFIVRQALAPIREASKMALAIGPGATHVRLPIEDLPQEVLPLAQAVNQALDRLEQGYQMQSDFTADAAHELRTPLAVLRTHVDTLIDEIAAAPLRTDIDAMSRIVDQLLELAELESVSIAAEEHADLNAVCTDVLSMMAPMALSTGKSIALVPSERPVWVSGNGEMLFRVIRNLVENAIRFTEKGTSVEVEVGAPATVSVKDRGPGIKPADRDLIFRRFWRRDRRDKGHSGLGLSIAARAIEIHGGSIDVGDRIGGGAVFRIMLPAGAILGSTTDRRNLKTNPMLSGKPAPT